MRNIIFKAKKIIKASLLLSCLLTVLSQAGQASPVVSVNAWLSATAPTDPISISINAAASDPSSTISKVDFYQGSTLLGTATSAPYSFTWSNVTAGTYTIKATATNAASQTASATISLPTSGWLRIMPLGDSITQGVGGQNSYRRGLWHELRNNSYLADFVGTWQNNCATIPIPDFDLNQNGWCGKQTTDLTANVTGFVSTARPDMVLLDIGTNDLANSRPVAETVANIGTIIDDIRSVNPTVYIIVAQISPTTQAYNANIPALNSGIVNLVAQKNTAQSPIRTIDLNTGFDVIGYTIDGLHPNDAGEEFFADRWYTGIASLLTTGSAPLVTSSGFIDATVGTAISPYTITATNSPTSYNATGLPAGITRSNAVISGTPTAAGTSLITVSATNASGTGSKVVTLTANPAGAFNEAAFWTPGSTVTGGGADTYNGAYNANTLPASVTFNGSTFNFGPANAPDAYNQETVNLPNGTYGTLNILATSGGGSVFNQAFVVHYQDGTTSTFTQSLSDWRNGVSYPNETAVVIMPTYLNSSGQVLTGNAYIYGYSFTLSAKPVQSITLPPARQALAFGFGLIGSGGSAPVITSSSTASGTVGSTFSYQITATNSPTSYGASSLPAGTSVNTGSGLVSGTPTTAATYNSSVTATNAGGTGSKAVTITISPSGGATPFNINAFFTLGTTVTNGGADNGSHAYESNLLGTTATYNGSTFTFGPANSVDAWNNLTVNLPAGTYTTLNMLGSAVQGNVTAQTFTVNYTDGTTSVFTQNMHDWLSGNAYAGETTVVTMANYLNSSGAATAPASYVHGYTFTLTGHAVQSITLPATRQVLAFGFAAGGVVSAPVINSALTKSGTVGTALSYNITATNSPTSYNATSLPAGLSVNTGTGLISGTPTTAGIYSVGISATNAGGTGSATLSMTINGTTTAFNIFAIFTVGTAPTNGGADNGSQAYDSNLLGTTATFNSSSFTYGAANVANAWNNTTVNLPPGTYTTLNMIGTAVQGNVTAQTFTVHYTDGTTSTFTQNMHDWKSSGTYAGETTVSTQANQIISTGAATTPATYVHGYTFTLSGHSVQSITLPATRQVLAFGFAGR